MFCLVSENLPTMEVKLSADTEEVIHVYPCTKRMAEKLSAMANLPAADKVAFFYTAAAEILSKNRENRVVTAEELEELPIPSLAAFFREYARFLRGEVTDNPN